MYLLFKSEDGGDGINNALLRVRFHNADGEQVIAREARLQDEDVMIELDRSLVLMVLVLVVLLGLMIPLDLLVLFYAHLTS